jgi:hypothetical protein
MLKNTRGLSGWHHKDYRVTYTLKKMDFEARSIEWWSEVYNGNWIWRQIVKVLKKKTKENLKMRELQKPHIEIWCWTNKF